jgi:hypothetical protein
VGQVVGSARCWVVGTRIGRARLQRHRRRNCGRSRCSSRG